jgi:hypothetical protein
MMIRKHSRKIGGNPPPQVEIHHHVRGHCTAQRDVSAAREIRSALWLPWASS